MKATYNGVTGEIINMTLTYHWFDRILSGKKKVEYRDGKDYWHDRLRGRDIKFIKFSRGYSSKTFVIEVLGIKANPVGEIDTNDETYERDFSKCAYNLSECDRDNTELYEIKLGRIVSKSSNIK